MFKYEMPVGSGSLPTGTSGNCRFLYAGNLAAFAGTEVQWRTARGLFSMQDMVYGLEGLVGGGGSLPAATASLDRCAAVVWHAQRDGGWSGPTPSVDAAMKPYKDVVLNGVRQVSVCDGIGVDAVRDKLRSAGASAGELHGGDDPNDLRATALWCEEHLSRLDALNTLVRLERNASFPPGREREVKDEAFRMLRATAGKNKAAGDRMRDAFHLWLEQIRR